MFTDEFLKKIYFSLNLYTIILMRLGGISSRLYPSTKVSKERSAGKVIRHVNHYTNETVPFINAN